MLEYLNQTILHTLVAAVVVVVLMRLWGIREPGLRLAFWLLAIGVPIVLTPAFWLLAPFRHAEGFADNRALFASSHLAVITVGGVGLDRLVFIGVSVVGVALFLADLLPLAARGLRQRGLPSNGALGDPAVARLVGHLAGRMGLTVPRVLWLGDPAPILFTAGPLRPTLVISRGTVERLDPRELHAAVAHELTHVAKRDALLGWLLMGARALMGFNPVAQWVARAAVREMEHRADDVAAGLAADPVGLASGILNLCQDGLPRLEPDSASANSVSDRLARLMERARTAAVERRCRRLLHKWPPAPIGLGWLRLGLTGFALSIELFFVV